MKTFLKLYEKLSILALTAILTPAFADDSNVVKLEHASSFYYSGGGFAGRDINIVVKVRNLAPDKTVTLIYNDNNTGWNELNIPFFSHHGNYDVFRLHQGASSFGGGIEFAIRYDVNGSTYWNNNDGLNHYLGTGDTTIIEDNVVLDTMTAGTSYSCPGYYGCTYITPISGDIFLENLSYHKNVGVRCSSDGMNWYNIPASYNYSRSGSNVEVWSYNGNHYSYGTYGVTPTIQCAAFYDGNWDNNFGQDFFVQDGETLN